VCWRDAFTITYPLRHNMPQPLPSREGATRIFGGSVNKEKKLEGSSA